MAKKDRTGNRKSREQRKQFKVPELGYYLIVTDTEAMLALVLCRQSKILGLVVQVLNEYMKLRLDRSISRLMSRCMKKFTKPATRKRQSR